MKALALSTMCMFSALPPLALGDASEADRNLRDWQLRRLTQPTPRQLEQEKNGQVYVYDGLLDREVDDALDRHFDRIQYMMFMGTVKTDSSGQPRINPDTGRAEQESGSCSE
jgi:hypothetical protein